MSDFIDELKKVKVPLWAQWLGYYRARQRRRAAKKEFIHVATLTHWTWLTNLKYYTRTWYILRERGDGKRFFDVHCEASFMNGRTERTHVYVHVVMPWMLGKYSNKAIQEWSNKQEEPAEPKE